MGWVRAQLAALLAAVAAAAAGATAATEVRLAVLLLIRDEASLVRDHLPLWLPLAYCAVAQPANYDGTSAEQAARALLTPLTGLLHMTAYGPRWRHALTALMKDRPRLLAESVAELVASCLASVNPPDELLHERPSLKLDRGIADALVWPEGAGPPRAAPPAGAPAGAAPAADGAAPVAAPDAPAEPSPDACAGCRRHTRCCPPPPRQRPRDCACPAHQHCA